MAYDGVTLPPFKVQHTKLRSIDNSGLLEPQEMSRGMENVPGAQ